MVFPKHTPPLQIATAGEALIDMIEEADGRLRPCAGGAVYNLTRALGLQGVGTLYLNPLSHDRFGRELAAGLLQAGVVQAREAAVPQPTSLAVVGLDARGKASYSFYRDGVADREVNAAGLKAACAAAPTLRVVATGCLALVPEDSPRYLPWLQAQRASGLLVVVDANLRPALASDMGAYRESVLAALQQAHLIKASDDDLLLLDLQGDDAMAQARDLLARTQATWLALTLGAQGAMLLHRDGRAWHASETTPVKVADTVGAGDSFLAGLLVALLQRATPHPLGTEDPLPLTDDDVRHLLAHAVASASLCVMQTGCVPPSLVEVQTRLRAAPPSVHTC
jgi:fructokinase